MMRLPTIVLWLFFAGLGLRCVWLNMQLVSFAAVRREVRQLEAEQQQSFVKLSREAVCDAGGDVRDTPAGLEVTLPTEGPNLTRVVARLGPIHRLTAPCGLQEGELSLWTHLAELDLSQSPLVFPAPTWSPDPGGPGIWKRGPSSLDGLERLPELKWLSLRGTSTASGLLPALSKLSKLTHLDLSETLVDDRALGPLEALPQLQWLSLRGCRITEASLARLARWPALRELDLRGTPITREGIERWPRASPVRLLHDHGPRKTL